MEMKQSIAHFSHVHELFLHDRVTSRPCKICNQTISGPFYNCDERCIFSIHISCAELPRHVQHPFHAQHTLLISPVKYHGQVDLCNACGGNIVGFKCKCTQCSFLLDIKCSVLTPTKKDSKSGEGHHQQEKKQTLDRQPNHRHLLIKCNKDENYSYACTCCELPIDGDGPVYVYVCLECKALLHKSCADLPLSIQHPFHPSHPLILLPRSLYNSKRFWCDACGQERNGFTYRCLECNFDLDIHCASLKPNRNIEGQELSHPHPFIVCEKTENFSHPCHVCGLPLADSIYFCPECKFLLHKSCADLPQEIKHLLHPQHALFFRYSRRGDNLFFYRSLQCRACLRNPDRYFFECSECEFYLDLKCAKSKPTTMISKVHLHRLVLSKEPYHKLLCDVCLQPFHNPFFLCPMRDFKVHVRCIRLLPTTIKSRHRHPLTLAYSPIKDHPDEDDEAEFYCDVCEETRVLKEPSYYCKECYSKECTYVAHPHCVVIEIIRALEEEWSRKESNGDGGEVEVMIGLFEMELGSVPFTKNVNHLQYCYSSRSFYFLLGVSCSTFDISTYPP
ncbi:Nucleoredoxin 1-1 like [Actinidia chinensis var. chinensis]|uniref:Nucleoredoxin 1-1 like n=1 Tax=Actinidia chinensis var. chinensis TaxID=1590841 RepID=A0A2R6QBZ8_ACTCC|nr:Nucleoredoxin 1-1 like [Actinidia chinensis var. chinensis]